MENKVNLKGKANIVIIICIVIIAALGITVGFLVGKSSKENDTKTAQTTQSVTTAAQTKASETESTTAKKETTTKATTTQKHVSPVESVSAEYGVQIECGSTLNREETKGNTYKAALSDFGLSDRQKIKSFTFIFSSDTTMDNYKGGFGISLKEGCSAATDDGWYQSDDMTYNVNSKYAEITWDVPSEIIDYIDFSGEVLAGYWWGSAQSIKLDYIICNISETAELPVDAVRTSNPGIKLDYNSTKKAEIDMEDFLQKGDEVQAVVFNVNADSSIGKFTGAFGISLKEGCNIADNYYQTKAIVKNTDSDSLSLTWIVPDEIKDYIDTDEEIDFGYWYGANTSITLSSVEIKCSNENASSPVQNNNNNNNNNSNSGSEAAPASSSSDFKSAQEIIAEIKVGWNLGNTLDSCDNDNPKKKIDETYWGNPKTTKAMIDSVKNAGFNAVRIPVTWTNHIDDEYDIDDDWMDRVEEVVDYAYNQGMYVILNTHHDEDWIDVNTTSSEGAAKKLWEEIADEFEDYDYHLIFEGFNELRTVGSPNEWSGGTPEERQNVNTYMQTFVDTVRADGGNNAKRTLIVTGYGQSINGDAVNDIKVPSGENIVVSIHSYAPYHFAMKTDSNITSFGSDADKKELDNGFDMLKSKFVDNGIPVIIGEFGAIDKNNQSDRESLYEYYISSAKQRGIKCFVWDNGLFKEDSDTDSYAIFDRNSLKWNDGILSAIMRGAA